ncbi:MAG: substrate-binding domain-containing protein [Bacteroidetes bacterium]|nr:substrate-binding domain-containing protein [Bacteroidota bacterium]
MNNMRKIIVGGFTLMVALAGCSDGPAKQEPTDTATSGEVNIVVDESFQKLFDNQAFTFEAIYKNAKINVSYLPENEALDRMLKDSCKVVVMCRDITAEERKSFEAQNLFPISTKIAEDAIVFIVNPENMDTILTVDKVKSILSGKDSTWTQLNKASQLGGINVVFDNAGSANARYMRDTLLGGTDFSKNVFAAKSNLEVIEYVNTHKNALGVLSVNWISDMDDSATTNILKKVKVVAIAKDEASTPVKAYQAYIKTKEYPFTRGVYMINRQTRAGLGMGFVSFVAGDKGQLMILKAGLVPAIAPVRLVEINIEK